MCTLTWFVNQQGYELFFNRDESVLRSHADLPTIQKSDGMQYISPTDADAGGTWIAVNQAGVTVCLLNHYEFEQIPTYKDWISRGEIVRNFAATYDLEVAEQQFLKLDLADYRAFRMFMINRQGDNLLCVWDGHSPRVERNLTGPKSSSAVDAKHVKELRRDLFNNLGLPSSRNSDDYLRFHASHLPQKSPESVCMHRAEANTVSLSHIQVDATDILFSYADGPPCEASMGEAIKISLDEQAEHGKLSIAATL